MAGDEDVGLGPCPVGEELRQTPGDVAGGLGDEQDVVLVVAPGDIAEDAAWAAVTSWLFLGNDIKARVAEVALGSVGWARMDDLEAGARERVGVAHGGVE